MKRLLRVGAAAVVGASATAGPAGAQSLAGKVAELIRFGTCPQSLCLVTGAGEHGTHYIGAATTANEDLLNFLTSSITAGITRLPISATSGGTTFSFVGGAPVQTTTSAGPIFAERAPTLGRGRFRVGLNTSRLQYEKLRGVPLSGLEINLAHSDVGTSGLGTPAFESDVVGIALDLDLTVQVSTAFATFGVSDNVDVSVAIPVVYTSMDGRSQGTIRNPFGGAPSGVHFFGTLTNPSFTSASSVDGSGTGLGDIAARVKFALPRTGNAGVALLADVRLPTGSEEEFRGAGNATATALAIASTRYGNFSPHVNVGYALRPGEGRNDGVLATVGFDHLLTRWATAAVDLLTEFQVGTNAARLPADVRFTTPAQTVRGTNIPDERDNPIGLSVGGRFLIGGFTAVANALVPVRSAGLQSNAIATLGIERSF